jgi:hypothetical protein
MDLKKSVNWIQLPVIEIQLWALVNSAINFVVA